MSNEVTYTFRRVPDLKSLTVTSGIDVLIAGDAYESWEQAVQKRQKFVGSIQRGPAVQDGTGLAGDAIRFVLFLQRGWRPDLRVARTCGSGMTTGEVEKVIATYQVAASKDPRKLIAQHFRLGSVVGRAHRAFMPVYVIFGIEAAGSIFVPMFRGPYLLWP